MRVSIQQAAANALASYLATTLPDVHVESRWVSNEKRLSAPTISIVMAGRRRDTAMPIRPISSTNNGANNTDTVWQVAACYQPLQLDVWTTSDVERDDILARLDDCLKLGDVTVANSNPVDNWISLALGDGWDEYDSRAEFEFGEPDTDDTSDDVGRSLFRARFTGGADFMLALKTTTSRLKTTNFRLFLDGTEA